MPIVKQPALIEVSDFSTGWLPDGLNDSTVPEAVLDSSNLIIDRPTGSLVTRPGYRRVREELSQAAQGSAITSDHYVKQISKHSLDGTNYIIAVVVKQAAEADNIQLYAIDLSDGSIQRIDTAGRTWATPRFRFWFKSIDGILYGGKKGEPMFSWDASGPTWNDDAAAPNTKTWVNDTGASVDTGTEFARDHAFTGKEFVLYSGSVYQPVRDIRYIEWEDGERYRKGDRVSRKLDGYYRSYRCIDNHTGGDTNKPDDGADWDDYWKRVRLNRPLDEDGDTDKDWALIPGAAETSIAMWFANRLWLRFDGHGDNSRAQYSAPIKLEKGEDIANTEWNPSDWAPGNDRKGQGGGWLPFNDGAHGGPITAMRPLGQYGVVFKRHSVWVVSGSDDASWNVRRIGSVAAGAIADTAVARLDGMLYFLSDRGLYVTDGTEVYEVPANNKVQNYLTTRLDSQMARATTDGHTAKLSVWKGFLVISLPDASDTTTPFVTIFYDPETESFWKTNLPVLDFIGYLDAGVGKYAFCRAPTSTSDSPLDIVYQFDKSNAGDADDTGAGTYASTAITWDVKTAWLPFGTARESRRIRRVWLVMKGAVSYTITQYRNWSSTTAATATGTGPTATGHIEGKWMEDCHAMQLKLAGTSAPASFYGYGVDTEPRRMRYHTG